MIPVNDRYIAEAANYLTLGIFDSLNIGLVGAPDFVDDGAFNVSNPLKYGWGWYYTDTELGFSLYANWFWLLLAIFFTRWPADTIASLLTIPILCVFIKINSKYFNESKPATDKTDKSDLVLFK